MKKICSLLFLCIAWGIGFAQTSNFFSLDTLGKVQLYGTINTLETIKDENPIEVPGTASINGVANSFVVNTQGSLNVISSMQIDFPSDFEVMQGGYLDAFISEMKFKCQYFELSKEISSDYVIANKSTIHFTDIVTELLPIRCVIYDDFQNEEGNTIIEIGNQTFGLNFFKIDIQSIQKGFHVLQISDGKNSKQYLRFYKQ